MWYYPDRSRTDRLSIRIGYIPSCCQNYHYPDNISIPHLASALGLRVKAPGWVCGVPENRNRVGEKKAAIKSVTEFSGACLFAPPRRPSPTLGLGRRAFTAIFNIPVIAIYEDQTSTFKARHRASPASSPRVCPPLMSSLVRSQTTESSSFSHLSHLLAPLVRFLAPQTSFQ